MSAGPHPTCGQCGAPLQRGQSYCLECGTRTGERSPQLLALLGSLREPTSAQAADAPPKVAQASASSAPALPPPRVSAVLVLLFLGFGVLLGDAASHRAGDTLASSRSPVKLLVGAGTASATPGSTSSTPPPSNGEATPTPGESSSSSSSTPASKSATSKPASASAPSGQGSPGTEGEGAGSPPAGSPSPGPKAKPPVKHVFVIVLADQPYASVFGPASNAPYLSQTLEQKGELLVRYYAVAHQGLANGVALISGQGPTVQTAGDCPTYSNIEPGTVGAEGQVSGSGCVYPAGVQTLAGQLAAKHLSWRAYVEGMDEPGSAAGACAHPTLGQADPTSAQPRPAGQTYATYRNPFVYFHAVIDSPSCSSEDVGVRQLSSDLASSARTPSFAYIVPDGCHDGSSTPCAPGAPSGPAAADGFLQRVVPEITSSPAYKQGGLLVITVDQAPSSGPFEDSSSCCGQPQFPNLPAPAVTVPGLPNKGGGQVGALLLSPYVKADTTNEDPYNHFSLLRTVEDFFGLGHLGYAGAASVSSFAPAVFSAYTAG